MKKFMDIIPEKINMLVEREKKIIKIIEYKIEKNEFEIKNRRDRIEDLWSFNTKEVAMAIHKSKKPIISAVGHEIDFLISDLVADVRAATPTQSMEIAVKERVKIEEMLMDRLSRAGKALRYKFENCKSEIKKRRGSYIIKRFEDIIPEKINMLIDREKDIINVMEYKIERLQNIVNNKKDRVEDLNPKNILKRGYSITLKDGKAVTKSSDLKIGDSVDTIFLKGKVKSEIKTLD